MKVKEIKSKNVFTRQLCLLQVLGTDNCLYTGHIFCALSLFKETNASTAVIIFTEIAVIGYFITKIGLLLSF